MSGPDFTVLDDLEAWRARLEPRGPVTESSGGLRCACPIHGGDNKSALSVTRPNGKVVVKCWTRGCNYADMRAELFPELQVVEERADEIRGTDGKVVAVHCRKKYGSGDKSVWWKRPGGANGLGGIKVDALPLYGSHLLADKPNHSVIVTEGEKAAEALLKRGIVAVGTVTGAEKCPGVEPLSLLRGREVILWPDRDTPGKAHMGAVGARLRGIAKRVTLFDWAEAPAKGDAADWRGSTEDLKTALHAAPEWKPETPKGNLLLTSTHGDDESIVPTINDALPTDLSNARRIVAAAQGRIRHSDALGWVVFDGRRWVVRADYLAMQHAKGALESLWDEVKSLEGEAAKKAAGWALQSQQRNRIKAALELAESEDGVHVEADAFDPDPWLLNVQNGTLDLRTCELKPHAQGDLITKLIQVAYDPQATAPRFDKMLRRIVPQRGVREFLQRWFGYSLTGNMGEQVFLFFYGTGANGKSTLVEVVVAAGGDYTKAAPFSTFTLGHGDRIPTDIAGFAGSRLVFAPEAPQGARLNEPLIKQIVGGDTLSARFMKKDFFEYSPSYKVTLVGNYRPDIKGTDEGIWRRVKVVHFGVQIPEDEQDGTLKDQIIADELPGVLAWRVEGCRTWQRTRLSPPPEVDGATREYRDEQNDVGRWLEEATLQGADLRAPVAALQTSYQGWCKQEGVEHLSWKAVSQVLKGQGYESGRESGTGRTVYRGLSIRPLRPTGPVDEECEG